MSSTPPVPVDGPAVPFSSLAELRAIHITLLKRLRAEGPAPEILEAVRAFLHNGRATGVVLGDTEERWSAQSILDYWVATLFPHTGQPLNVALAAFDPREAPHLDDEDCPYPGLDAFLERDHDRFFGRERLVDELLARLRRRRVLVLAGPPGSGKSSVALAGLLAALRRGGLPGSAGWRCLTLVPGSAPLDCLARLVQSALPRDRDEPIDGEGWVREQVGLLRGDSRHLARMIGELGPEPVVIIVDQFEEIFTLCDSTTDRGRFLANLLYLTLMPAAASRVIFTIRSDFERYLLQIPRVGPFLDESTVRVLPLNAAELREAIERPAAQIGLKFDSGVVDSLIGDILGEPAALPLLQFTLYKLWAGKQRNRVTWEHYRRLGGGRAALATSADAFYHGLTPEERITAQRILLRMVLPGDGLEVTSSRVRRELLFQEGEDPSRVERLLARLIDERLVRSSGGATPADNQVELAHEALARNWPQLVAWVEQARGRLRARFRLRGDAEEWNARGHDATLLLGETRLLEAEAVGDLNRIERAYVLASRAALDAQRRDAERARVEREQALRRELEQQLALGIEREQRREAEQRAVALQRANARLRRLTTTLTLVMAIAVGLAILAAALALSGALG